MGPMSATILQPAFTTDFLDFSQSSPHVLQSQENRPLKAGNDGFCEIRLTNLEKSLHFRNLPKLFCCNAPHWQIPFAQGRKVG